MTGRKSSDPDELADDGPDTAILLAAGYRVVVDRLLAAMEAAGLTMRPTWGYVIRALHDQPLPLVRLAELLAVSKQAAQQTVDDMQRAGLVERHADPDDRRRKLLALTDDGRRVRATALAVSADLDRELGADGPALRRALLGLVERHGDLDDVQARRARMPW
ncbi:MarR family winged helix-turn-helix transcriptional regulator [Patulibacter defluvii]|uniref:MarR family winged helix-turn-helix transcriptional regulator n=1 Tax=Patulibacter defluvii TaxID=3095358 RepID=UPI002A74BD59|nr:MarR family winged helix-turn-helix transcriptional regulator [Patulibacter sp. DM4]